VSHKVEKVKTHLQENKKFYIGISIGLTVAGITYVIMRDVKITNISRELLATADRELLVIRQNGVMNNISYISSNRSGPPSWVVRCKETGDIFTSQREAAAVMNLSASDISRHLNGLKDHVNGNTFERICMAA
jgi:hypothetical protein